MAHTHEFDCNKCGAHLDSREALDQHTRKQHPAAAQNEPMSASSHDSVSRATGDSSSDARS